MSGFGDFDFAGGGALYHIRNDFVTNGLNHCYTSEVILEMKLDNASPCMFKSW